MIVNRDSIVQHVNQIKNRIMIYDNMSIKSVIRAKKLWLGILAQAFVIIVGI